ncbi:hypothetical protein [Streptomyces javensis]|uniref:Uncharacterized protein n=1 Tax=Streptomyces javensis TaxID=114698 RepID=A0ABS0R8P3_9ACTN|nr:hypothetical protein [Streptomyces javensis]MBI0313752.1 hypothetical protein [Streptomyces javensis]
MTSQICDVPGEIYAQLLHAAPVGGAAWSGPLVVVLENQNKPVYLVLPDARFSIGAGPRRAPWFVLLLQNDLV